MLLLLEKRPLGERLSKLTKGRGKQNSTATIIGEGDEGLDIALIDSSMTGHKDEWFVDSGCTCHIYLNHKF